MRIIKNTMRLIFSRLTIGIVLIVAQVYLLLRFFQNMPLAVRALIFMANIVVVFIMLDKDESPSFKIPWLFVCIFLPSVGALFYLFCGRSNTVRYRKKRHNEAKSRTKELIDQDKISPREKILDPLLKSQSHYIETYAEKPIYENTKATYYKSGEDAFPQMLEDLKQAKHYIFLEFFIMEEGKVLNSVVDILEEKVKEGLKVRVMYDDLGCILKLPGGYYKTLEKKGIEVIRFNPFVPVLSAMHNYRDHRKIMVIDGYIGYTGGINLADEYMNFTHPYGYWKDSMTRLYGEAVQSLTMMLLETWAMYAKEPMEDDLSIYRPRTYHKEPFEGEEFQGLYQPYGYSPLETELVAENIYINLLNHAKEYCYISTPYLLANYEVLAAIKLAAKRGVDVKILLPGQTDAWYVSLVTRSYYYTLIEAGVQLYEYTPGFLHEKAFLCDNQVGVVGTVNLDYRSLVHHFECGIWIYNAPMLIDLHDDFKEMLKQCRLIDQNEADHFPWYEDIMRRVLQLFGPLL